MHTDNPPSAAALPATGRIAWVDTAKGLGILLVVIGHGIAGLMDSALGRGSALLHDGFAVVYFFHMPMFFLLSGLHVQPRLQRDRDRFQRSLFRNIAYPYLVWSFLQFNVIFFAGSLVNTPIEGGYWTGIANIAYKPGGQFWFLYSLLLCHLASLFLLPTTGALGFLFLMVLLKSATLIVPLPDTLGWTFYQAPYYALGLALGTSGVSRIVTERPVWMRGVALPLVAAGLLLVTLRALIGQMGPDAFATAKAADIAVQGWGFNATAAAISGGAAVIAVSSLLGNGRLVRTVQYLGQKSLSIYVMHILLLAGARIVLVKFLHVADPWVILPCAVAIALLGALAGDFVFVKLRLAKPLGLA